MKIRAKYVELIQADSPDTAVSRFCAYYENRENNFGRDWKTVCKQLRALPKPATKDEVEKLIGNKSWTSITCGSCFKEHQTVLNFPKSAGFVICKECLLEANELAKDLDP